MYRGLRFCSTVIIIVGILVSLPLLFMGGTSLGAAVAAVASPTPVPDELAEFNIDTSAMGALAGGIGMAIAFG